MIHNPDAPEVIEVKKLRTRSYRKTTGQVIVEGLPEVKRAIHSNTPIDVLYICPEIVLPTELELDNLNTIDVSKEVFAQMAFGSRLKGVLAICKPQIIQLADISFKRNPFVVVLENVEKPGNLGSVIRSCDGAGVDGLIMCDGKTDLYNQHVVRSSIGTIFTVNTVSSDKEQTFEFLRQHNIQILAATAKADTKYTDIDFTLPSAIIMGNEHSGVSSFWMERADHKIGIPMLGSASSLNVTVSASILIYEALRQR